MLSRLFLVALIPALLFTGPALAADTPDSGAPLATGAASTDDQIAAFLADLPSEGGAVSPADAYGGYIPFDDRRPHSEVGVGIGNHGYRSVYARQTLPVGQTGTLDVAVAHEQFKAPGWGKQSMTGLSVGLDFSRPRDPCATDAPPWRRDRQVPAGCIGLQRGAAELR